MKTRTKAEAMRAAGEILAMALAELAEREAAAAADESTSTRPRR